MRFSCLITVCLVANSVASPFTDESLSGGAARAYGNIGSISQFKSSSNVQNGHTSFAAGGGSRGESVGLSNAFVRAQGAQIRHSIHRAGGEIQAESQAYGNIGSGSQAGGGISATSGIITAGGGRGISSGAGFGFANSGSAARIAAVDRRGHFASSSHGSSSGNGGLVHTESESRAGLGYAKSTNEANAKSNGFARVHTLSNSREI